jgi:hypothetical protein
MDRGTHVINVRVYAREVAESRQHAATECVTCIWARRAATGKHVLPNPVYGVTCSTDNFGFHSNTPHKSSFLLVKLFMVSATRFAFV